MAVFLGGVAVALMVTTVAAVGVAVLVSVARAVVRGLAVRSWWQSLLWWRLQSRLGNGDRKGSGKGGDGDGWRWQWQWR